MPLPPQQETLSLLKDYFENFNCMFPLFHEPTFMHLVRRHYSKDPYHGSGWWASLNIALAIAHRLRVMSNLVPQEEDNQAWSFLKNALGVYSELTLRNTDLLSVQALLGMVRLRTKNIADHRRPFSFKELQILNRPSSSSPVLYVWRIALASTSVAQDFVSILSRSSSGNESSGLPICLTKSKLVPFPRRRSPWQHLHSFRTTSSTGRR